MRRTLTGAIVGLGIVLLPVLAVAQDYPTKPIQLIVPFPPGGGTDLAARLAADYLTSRLGQQVVVINKPGAGTVIGLDLGAKARPDGYTLVWATSDGVSIAPALKSKLPYKIPEDFAFVAATAKVAIIAAVSSKQPFQSVADLIAYAKANPGKVRYSSPGVGTGAHMGTALLAKVAGIDMVHVPYNGAAAAVTATVGGVVELIMSGSASIKPFSDAGSLRPLGTADKERHPQFPNLPTLEESGLPDLEVVMYMGVLAPSGTPDPILDRLRKEIAMMIKDPLLRDRVRAIGLEPTYLDGPDFRNFMVKDVARWKDVARSANIVVPE